MGPSRRVSSRTGSIGCACVDLERVVAAVRCDSLRQSGWRVLVAPHDQVSVAVHWLVFDHSQAVHRLKMCYDKKDTYFRLVRITRVFGRPQGIILLHVIFLAILNIASRWWRHWGRS